MATLDKLIKSWDALKNLPLLSEELPSRRKEKILFCVTIADTFCSTPGLKSGGTGGGIMLLLSFAIESLLQMCNDSDSDVRMTADESLNRIIRQAITDSHAMKIQVELHKEIKRNGNARSLRAALSRFAHLCHLIRPQKGKPYVNNLIPCLIQISKRCEEPVQETLSSAMPGIFQALGVFTTDKDVKGLLKAFLFNLSSDSAQIRRTAASCIVSICQYSRKPHVFLTDILSTLVDLLTPIREEQNVFEILGVLGCLRAVLPHLVNCSEQIIGQGELKGSFGVRRGHKEETSLGVDRMIQVYELSIYFSRHVDHNVVNAALELLHHILVYPPPEVLPILLSPHGISRSRILLFSDDQDCLNLRSLSQMSVAGSVAPYDESMLLELDSDLPNAMSAAVSAPLLNKWMLDSSGNEKPSENFSGLVVPPRLQLLDAADPAEPDLCPPPEHENSAYTAPYVLPSDAVSERLRDTPQPMMISRSSTELDRSPPSSAGAPSVSSPSPGASQVQVKYQVCDIGSLTDGSIPLVYCARHLAASFLLTGHPGYLMPDRSVRVSVKALALNCVAAIVRLHPNVFQLYLDKEPVWDGSSQPVCDLLHYSKHADPQLRANCCTLVASVIRSVLVQSGGNWRSWQLKADNRVAECLGLSSLVHYLVQGLEDESSTTCRQSLVALAQCFSELLESRDSAQALPIIQPLTSLSRNPYWLVKVKLAELVSELPYVTLCFVTGSEAFQDKVLHEILLKLLGDEDSRVRKASAEAIVRIVPKLYFMMDHVDASPVITMASQLSDSQLGALLRNSNCNISKVRENRETRQLPPRLENLTPPFDTWNAAGYPSSAENPVEASLSRLIYYLSHLLLQSSSKHLTLGCCETLSYLAVRYPPTVHINAWNCSCSTVISHRNSSKWEAKRPTSDGVASARSPASGLLHSVLSLLQGSSVSLDLRTQRWLASLAGNLFCGLAVANMRPVDGSPDLSQSHSNLTWSMFQDRQLSLAAETILLHAMRMLNILFHVLEDSHPSSSSSKPGLPSLSPIKRHASSVGKNSANATDSPADSKSGRGMSPIRNVIHGEKEEKSEEKKSGKHSPFGSFANNQHYMKVFDLLRSSYSSYKISLEAEACQKLIESVSCILTVLSQLLEVMTVVEAGRLAEELLSYLKCTISISPVPTVHCVNQLLKCVVGMNLVSFWNDRVPDKDSGSESPSTISNTNKHGFYFHCFQKPYQQLSDFLSSCAAKPANVEMSHAAEWMSSLHPRSESKTVFPFGGRTADTSFLASYIRLFEPMVIESLQQYTVTSDVQLQVEVLLLLTQLVQLRVNYCLLDSDMIFIGFVHKQFEFIEEGQILNAESLIKCIFHFMVLLSFENRHTKSITTIPKVIQLCDGLMASGQNPLTHCIPALLPVVEHGFLSKTSNSAGIDADELEIQREVLVAMLLRLVEYHQVMDLLNLVLVECRSWHDGEERWERWSLQVAEAVLSLLASGRLRLDSPAAQQALHRLLLFSIAPSALQPVDAQLRVLFSPLPQVESSTQSVIRWLGTILAVMLQLVAQGKEDATLARLEALNISLPAPSFRSAASPDPLNVTAVATPQPNTATPQLTFARLVLRAIGFVGEKIDGVVMDPASSSKLVKECEYLQELLAHFLLVCIHMFQSGSHSKIGTAAVDLVAGHATEDSLLLEDANAVFLQLAPACPLLMFLWCYLLTLLNYGNHAFWKRVLPPPPVPNVDDDDAEHSHPSQSIRTEIVRTGATIVYCDYICENPSETEQLSWLLTTQMMQIVEISTEPPVQTLIAVLHRDSDHSGEMFRALRESYTPQTKATSVIRLLRFLEGVHPSQSGSLLLLLATHLVSHPHPLVARRAAQLCTRQAEYLLTQQPSQVAELLSREQLRDVLQSLHRSHLNRKHSGLVSVLNKLGSQCLALSPLGAEEARPVTPSSMQALNIDKEWYLNQVKLRCSQASSASVAVEESALLLGRLNLEDAVSVLSSPDTHLSILQLCFRHGTHQTLQARASSERVQHLEDSLSPLYRAARMVLMQHVHHFIELVPKDHQVFLPLDRLMTESERDYSHHFCQILSDKIQLDPLFRIAAAVSSYLQSLGKLSGVVPSEATEDLAAFALLCLEAVHCLVRGSIFAKDCEQIITLMGNSAGGATFEDSKELSDEADSRQMSEILGVGLADSVRQSPQPYCLELGLECACQVICESSLCVHFERPERASWLASACSSVCAVVQFALQGKSLPSTPQNGLANALSKPETRSIAHACHQMSTLVTWLEKQQLERSESIPGFLSNPIRKLTVRLSRAPLLNSYVWTPPEVWRHGWAVPLDGPYLTHVPPLPTEFLQDMEVLRQFIFRVTFLGWTSRQQFEETWMSLLSVLSPEIVQEEIPAEELMITTQANSLVVKAITALLLQTLLLPVPGDPNSGQYMHVSRDRSIEYASNGSAKKLYAVQQLLVWKQEGLQGSKIYSVFNRPNLDHGEFLKRFEYCQMSVEYLKYALESSHGESINGNFSNTVVAVFEKRLKALETSGLDLNSCLYFLLDLFTQWTQPVVVGAVGLQSRFLHEVLCSALAVSDLFTEQSQWLWLLNLSLHLAKSQPSEDDILQQYIILAQCKAHAVLQPEAEIGDRVRRSVDSALRSSFAPTVAAALQGLLYLLEGAVVPLSLTGSKDSVPDSSMTSPNSLPAPMCVAFVTDATYYVKKNLTSCGSASSNEEVCLLTWAVALFLLDNFSLWKNDVLERAASLILQQASSVAHPSRNSTPAVQRAILQGLERLVVSQSEALSPQAREQVTKLAVETLGDPNPTVLLRSLQLLLSCMYMGCSGELLTSRASPHSPSEEDNVNLMDPEQLVQAMEKTSALFDRIKKGYPQEVELVCSVLPHILTDFFPASEVLTKVIGEFLSPQQPHPRLLSGVVFQVFECAVAQSQLSLLQEWFVLSLSNFTQTLPAPMATWCLTCFFISASRNPWLRALFPHVQSRIGRCEFEDRKLLCLSAADFYRELTSDSLTQKFVSTFQAAVKRQPNSPFAELIASLG